MEDNKIHIIIIGAGPGGLMAGYRLKSFGFKVTIIEKTKLENICADIGGAYDISGNTRKVFYESGLGKEFDELGGRIKGFTMVNGVNGNIFKDAQLGDGFIAGLRRSEIQKLLINAYGTDDLICGNPMKSLKENENSVIITLENGDIIEGDFIIGADGIRSSVLYNIFPEEADKKLRFANCVSIWGFFDYDNKYSTIMKPGYGMSVQSPGSMIGGGVHGIGKEAVWAALQYLEKPSHHNNLQSDDIKQDILNFYKNHKPETVYSMMEATDANKMFKVHVYDRDPLDSWSKGRCVLIGDAAHAMNPFAGQGANMAIIDGFLLGTLLYNEIKDFSKENVPLENLSKVFKHFESIRKIPASNNLKQARQTSELLMEGGKIKSFMFRAIVWMIPQKIFSHFLFKADEQNNSALEACGIEPCKISFF